MNATATGHSSNAIGESSIAVGQNATASGTHSIAIGVAAIAGGKEKEGTGSIAIANIPALELNKKFSVGIGVGHYITASAIAISAQSRIAENIVLKLSGSTAMGNVVTGAGLGISF